MRTRFLLLTLAACLVPTATGQVTDVNLRSNDQAAEVDEDDDKKSGRAIGPNEVTERAVARAYPLMAEWRARYLMRQLDLTDPQRDAAEGLIATVLNQPSMPINLGRVRELMGQMQQAEADRDEEAKARITKELRELGKERDHEPEFLDNLRLQITEEQQKKLDDALARLERNPSGHIRPVDVLDFVSKMKLNDEQKKQVDEVKEDQRRKGTTAGRLDDTRRAQMMRTMVRKMNEFLTEPQRAALDAEIQKLRTDKVRNIHEMDAQAERAARRIGARRGQP